LAVLHTTDKCLHTWGGTRCFGYRHSDIFGLPVVTIPTPRRIYS
jgi:hypothetical protein